MVGHHLFPRGMVSVLGGALLITSVGCSEPLSTREKAALIGGGVGAGAGALIGGGEGAAIGGALGAGSGALVGDRLQDQERRQDAQELELRAQERELERQRREIERLEDRAGY